MWRIWLDKQLKAHHMAKQGSHDMVHDMETIEIALKNAKINLIILYRYWWKIKQFISSLDFNVNKA